jgi:O-antigen ligase
MGLAKFLQWGLMGTALVVTFLRSYWAALLVVMCLMVYLVRGAERQKLMAWAIVVASSAALILLVVFNTSKSRASTLLDASWHRFSTLLRSGTFQGQEGSVELRMIENRYALSAIASSPLIGYGLGVPYRPWDSRLDHIDANGVVHDLRLLIHNGHLTVLLQSGLAGYLSLMWMSVVFLTRGFKYWRSLPDDRMRGVMLGFTLAYLAVLIAAVANSSFMQWRWTPVIGIMMGINEVMLRNNRPEESVA